MIGFGFLDYVGWYGCGCVFCVGVGGVGWLDCWVWLKYDMEKYEVVIFGMIMFK